MRELDPGSYIQLTMINSLAFARKGEVINSRGLGSS